MQQPTNKEALIQLIVDYVKLHGGEVSTRQLCEAFREELGMADLFEDEPAVDETPTRMRQESEFPAALILALPYLDFESKFDESGNVVGWLRTRKSED